MNGGTCYNECGKDLSVMHREQSATRIHIAMNREDTSVMLATNATAKLIDTGFFSSEFNDGVIDVLCI